MLPDLRQTLKLTDSTVQKLEKLHIHNAWDLALHLPLRYEDETQITPIAAAPIGEMCQVEGEVVLQEVQFKPRKQLIARIRDSAGGLLNLRFIHFYPSQQQQLAKGQRVRALGEIKQGYYGAEMIHPKIKSPEKSELAQTLTPVYPTTNGLTQPTLRKAIAAALQHLDLREILPESVLRQYNLPTLADSLRLLHNPPPSINLAQISNGALPAWQRLKFDNCWRNNSPCA